MNHFIQSDGIATELIAYIYIFYPILIKISTDFTEPKYDHFFISLK